jgi:hypothetical protein
MQRSYATAEQRPKVFSFVISALDLMCLPRPAKNVSLIGEAMLLARVRESLQFMPLSLIDREAVQAAYGRLQASGIEARPEMELDAQERKARFIETLAKAKSDSAARGLKSCAHCGAREAHVAHLKRCSACKGVVLCSKACQLANWPAHKAACKAARKAAAGDAGGA